MTNLIATGTVPKYPNVRVKLVGKDAQAFSIVGTVAKAMDEAGVPSSTIADPRHQLQLRSNVELSRGFSLDTAAFYVGRVGNNVPAYVRLDAQLSWRAARHWELSISGQNLLDGHHAEFAGGPTGQSDGAVPIQRTVNGRIAWRF